MTCPYNAQYEWHECPLYPAQAVVYLPLNQGRPELWLIVMYSSSSRLIKMMVEANLTTKTVLYSYARMKVP